MGNDNLNLQGKKGLTSKQIVDNFNSNIPKDNLRGIVFFCISISFNFNFLFSVL